MRVTLQKALAMVARLPQANLCADAPEATDLVNEAEERLVVRSKGTLLHRKVRLCTSENCVVMPRQIASATDWALCHDSVKIRNQWYEFLPYRSTVFMDQNEGFCGTEVHDRGTAFAPYEIIGTKALKIYTDIPEDPGVYLYFAGLDHNGIPPRVEWDVPGEFHDHWRIDLSTANPAGVITPFSIQSFTNPLKDITKGTVRIYEYDTVNLTERFIAMYEWDETEPLYRKYLVRGNANCPTCTTLGAAGSTVTAMCKLEYIQARDPRQELICPSLSALKLMCMSILKDNADQTKEADRLADRAVIEMGYAEKHYFPKEQIAVQQATQGTARLRYRRIGNML